MKVVSDYKRYCDDTFYEGHVGFFLMCMAHGAFFFLIIFGWWTFLHTGSFIGFTETAVLQLPIYTLHGLLFFVWRD